MYEIYILTHTESIYEQKNTSSVHSCADHSYQNNLERHGYTNVSKF